MLVLIVLVPLVFLTIDYYSPNTIRLKKSFAFGMKCLRARELIIQEADKNGALWASRGMILYKLEKGKQKFIKVARVPIGLSLFWLNNFTMFRRLTLRAECIEIAIDENGTICAFAAGSMWQLGDGEKKFKKTGKMPHFGRGVGRGVMSHGIMAGVAGEFFFGEYFNNPDRIGVAIYKYDSSEKKWIVPHKFGLGQVRHVHALQTDPFTGKLWVCTGDEGNEPMIGWSDDGFKSINPIGQGSQKWRACQLVFTESAIYWGTDTGSVELAGIYRWDRVTMELTQLIRTEGAIFYSTRLADGTIVMSTDRENFPNENDDKTRLYILSKNGKISALPCGTWDFKKPGFRYNFAKLRLQRNQGNEDLVMSVLNQKEFADGDLLMFMKNELDKAL